MGDKPIRVQGARPIDWEIGEQPQTSSAATESLVDLGGIRLDIDKGGVPLRPMGVGKLIRPMIDVEKAGEIKNPAGRVFVKSSSWLLDKLHTGIGYLYAGITEVDQYLFNKGLDRLTGLNNLGENLATHARWGERALAVTAGVATYKGIRSRSAAAGLRGAGRFWRGAWPIGAMLYLSQTKVASSLEEGAGLAALGGALILLNYPTASAYRRVITPTGATPMALKWGLIFGLSHFGMNYYWDNWSAQARILPGLHHQAATDAYKPWKWDWRYTQANTTYSHSIGWGLFGSAWGSLLVWQTNVTDRISKKLFGFGKEVLQITEGTASHRFVHQGFLSRFRAGRGAKAFLASFAPRRSTFTGFSTLVGLPLGIALGRLTFEAQDFSSVEAVTGTPARTVITAPLSTAGIAACTAMFGVAHPWCSYALNMYPVNWRWQAEAQQGEILYQVAKSLTEDYKASDDPNDKRRLATLLFNLHRVAYDNGRGKEGNEKMKIGEMIAGVGIDVEAIEQAATQYAAPSLPLER